MCLRALLWVCSLDIIYMLDWVSLLNTLTLQSIITSAFIFPLSFPPPLTLFITLSFTIPLQSEQWGSDQDCRERGRWWGQTSHHHRHTGGSRHGTIPYQLQVCVCVCVCMCVCDWWERCVWEAVLQCTTVFRILTEYIQRSTVSSPWAQTCPYDNITSFEFRLISQSTSVWLHTTSAMYLPNSQCFSVFITCSLHHRELWNVQSSFADVTLWMSEQFCKDRMLLACVTFCVVNLYSYDHDVYT